MAIYKVIDVSEHQKTINWKKVKAFGIQGVIVRYADGTYLDPKFDINMKGAKAVGLHVGCYIYSRAKTTKEAEKEASRLYLASKKYEPDLPLYIDLEAKGLERYGDIVAAAFLDKMKELGGYGGVYANLRWWNNFLKKTAKKYTDCPFWIAQYYSKMEYKPSSYMGMWQYTSSGRVDGISTKVDRDKLYVPYWEKISPVKKSEKASEPAQATVTAPKVLTRSQVISNMNAYAEKLAADNRLHYVTWKPNDAQTHKCPICSGVIEVYEKLSSEQARLGSEGNNVKHIQKCLNIIAKSGLTVDGMFATRTKSALIRWQKSVKLTADGVWGVQSYKAAMKALKAYLGWNCIGAGFNIWHHGGGLKSKCNCGVISNEVAEQIYKAKTDAEALKIVKAQVGIDDVKVIRNGKYNIPKEKWKAGDIGLKFNGDKYQHTFYIMGNGKIFDSSGRGGDGHNDIAVRNITNYTARIIIRWTGGEEALVKKKYAGSFPSTELVKMREQVIADAITFAKWIANDNSFHYGAGKDAHHNGCYFCGTQPASKKSAGIVDHEHTYCCNPFVGACWAHGGCLPAALALCKKGSSWSFDKGKGYDKSSLFSNLGKPDISKLEAGDVLCSDKHVALYIGNGKIAEAASEDDNKKGSTSWNKSIRIAILTDSRYKSFKRVHRLKAGVKTTIGLNHGEVSDRVKKLQLFLKWYGYDVKADRIFGDSTRGAVKKFQKASGITVDGIVGPKTIAAMKKAVK